MIALTVNGQRHELDVESDTPLLYVLRDDLELNAAKFGCGLGQCGACTVLLDGRAVMSCLLPVAAIGERKVTTLEGLGTEESPHPLQRAFVQEQAAQCGYCIAGMIMRAEALLRKNPTPTDDQILDHMSPNLCRCGTHMRIVRAIQRVARGAQTASADTLYERNRP
jgi:nicotinate dehydrogenase subunit A